MSNEPTSKRLWTELLPDASAGAGAEAAGGGPEMTGRLRADLDEMAALIAQVGLVYEAAGSTDEGVAALLRELDVRVRRMMTIVDPPAEAVAENEPRERSAEEAAFLEAMEPGEQAEIAPHTGPGRVPTVSDVVWQLGQADETATPDASCVDEPPDSRTSAVAMLEARVKALAESMPQAPQNEVRETVPEPPPEPAASAPAEHAPPRSPIIPEVELMWNFQRMESEPYFPPEVGEAVIFGRERTAEPAAAPAATGRPVTGDVDLNALLFEPQGEPEADPAAFLIEPEPAPEQPPQEAGATPAAETPTAPEPTAEAPATSWDAEPAVPAGAPSPGARPDGAQDPLAPLMAMSDEEKIALFE